MAGISQRQAQTLLQKVSPQQIQTLKLLELPATLMEQRIKQEIENNPVLEEEIPGELEEELRDEEEEPKEVPVEDLLAADEVPYYKSQINNFSKEVDRRQFYITEGYTFRDSLLQQLPYKKLDARAEALAEYLIDSLEDDGYLRRDLQSVADDLAFNNGVEVETAELEEVLHVVQQLDPPGVGARTLQECLLLQLDARPSKRCAYQRARTVLTNHFDLFTTKSYNRLMSALGIGKQSLRDVINLILSLSPKPGSLYSDDPADRSPYIIPDFVLDYQDGVFDLRTNNSHLPDLRVNPYYADQIRSMLLAKDGARSRSSREALQFVRSKINSAQWFIQAIQMRQDTMLRTMQAIFDLQREFFVEGDVTMLRPMILQDIADAIGMDASTISRVVSGKYIQTHFGVVPLKYLFTDAVTTDSGKDASTLELRQAITQIIADENKQAPLSDAELAEKLVERGYWVTRRNVAKYRQSMNIPTARMRQEL